MNLIELKIKSVMLLLQITSPRLRSCITERAIQAAFMKFYVMTKMALKLVAHLILLEA